jgi:hypothetical protein
MLSGLAQMRLRFAEGQFEVELPAASIASATVHRQIVHRDDVAAFQRWNKTTFQLLGNPPRFQSERKVL